jgi:hypothetical protein
MFGLSLQSHKRLIIHTLANISNPQHRTDEHGKGGALLECGEAIAAFRRADGPGIYHLREE